MGWISTRTWMASLAFLLLLAAGVRFVVIVRGQQQSIPMPNESLVELTVEHEGTTYKLVHGDLYRVASPDRLVFVERIYDKGFRKTNYIQQDGQVFRVDTDTGKLYRTRRHFEDGFENADRIADLIRVDRGWNTFTLQSPKTPSVSDHDFGNAAPWKAPKETEGKDQFDCDPGKVDSVLPRFSQLLQPADRTR